MIKCLLPRSLSVALVTLIVSIGGTSTLHAAFQDSYETEELFAVQLVNRRLYDYAKDQIKHMRLNYRQQATSISIVEARLLAATSQRSKAIELLNKVPKDSPDYPKALLVGIQFEADAASRAKKYETYFKAIPKPTSPVAIAEYKQHVFIYCDQLMQNGNATGAKAALELIKGLPGSDDEGTKRRLTLMSGQFLLAGAEKMREDGKPAKEYLKLVKSGLKELNELIWIPDYWSAMAYPEIFHAHNLLGEPDEALNLFEMAYPVMKQIEDDLLKQSGTVQGTPLAPAIFYLGESYVEKARQVREAEKREKDEDKKAEMKKETEKLLIIAAKYYYKVYESYEKLPRANDALAELDKITRILEKFYNRKVDFGAKQAVDVLLKTANERYAAKEYTQAAKSYLEAIRINLNGAFVMDAAYFCTASLYRTGKFWEAMAINDLLIEKFPGSEKAGQSTYNLGVALLREAKRIAGSDPAGSAKIEELSLDYLQLFVEIAPTHPFAPDTAYRIADTQYAKATELRKEAKELEANGKKVEQINAKIADAKRAYEKAIPMYQSVIDNHGASANAHLAKRKLAWIFQILEQRDESARFFLAFADGEEEDMDEKVLAKYMAADSFYRADDVENALEHFNELLAWTEKGGAIPASTSKIKSFRSKTMNMIPWVYDLKARQLSTKVEALEKTLEDVIRQAEEAPKEKPVEEKKEQEGEGVTPEDTTLKPEDIKSQLAQMNKDLEEIRLLAIDGFDGIIKRDPTGDNAPELMRRIGSIYGQMGKFDKAAEWLERLDKEHPKTEAGQQALFTLFRSYMKINDTEKAKGVTKRMLSRLDDYSLPTVMFLATRMFEIDEKMNETVVDPELALAANREVIKRGNTPAGKKDEQLQLAMQRARFLEAKSLYLMKKHNDAVEKGLSFIADYETSPYYFDAKIIIGSAYRELNKMQEASIQFDEILEVIDKDEYAVSYHQAVLESARTLLKSENPARVKLAVVRLKPMVDFADEENEELQPYIEAAYYELARTFAILGMTEKVTEYRNLYLGKYVRGLYRQDILRMPAARF